MKLFLLLLGHYLPVLFSIRVEVRMSSGKMQMDGMSEFESNSEEVVNSEVALKEQLVDVLPKL